MNAKDVVDLTRLPPTGVAVERVLDGAAFFEGVEDVQAEAPVGLRVSIRRSGDGFVARGRVEAPLRLRCGRCLGPFVLEAAAEFTEEYRARPDEFGSEVRIRREDLVLSFLEGEGETLDLRELAREQLLLLVPMKPLCAPGCAGLCPVCGADRNRGDCGCRKPMDPRLQALEEIRRKLGSERGKPGRTDGD